MSSPHERKRKGSSFAAVSIIRENACPSGEMPGWLNVGAPPTPWTSP